MDPTDVICSVDFERCPNNFLFCFHAKTILNIGNLEKLREQVEQQIASDPYGKLKLKISNKFGFQCWENLSKGSFDIKDHVKICPEVNSWEKTISQNGMMSLAKNVLHSSLHPRGKPDWEILLLPRVRMRGTLEHQLTSEVYSTVIIRINHAYMDANCAIRFINKVVLDEEDTPSTLNSTLNILDNTPHASFFKRLTFFIRVLLYGPAHIASIMWRNSGKNIFHQTSSNASYLQRSKLNWSCAALNKIKIAFNCDTKSIIAHAFLKSLYQSAEGKGVSLPPTVNLAFAHAMPSYRETKLENSFSAISRSLPTTGGPNQLHEIKKLMQINESNLDEVTAVFWMTKAAGCLPLKLYRLLRNSVPCPCTLSVVPSSERGLKFQGGSVERLFAVPPLLDGTHLSSCSEANVSSTFNQSGAWSFHLSSSLNLTQSIVISSPSPQRQYRPSHSIIFLLIASSLRLKSGSSRLKSGSSRILKSGSSRILKSGSSRILKSGSSRILKSGSSRILKSGSSRILKSGSSRILKSGSSRILKSGSSRILKSGSSRILKSGSSRILKSGSSRIL
ncbi:unnamed protein product [Orchesella dallaii]|uniref:O-acyltransferase WSD1 C-terminal domain-containing protein n=1 Tax=Orchesella dallaii TaxID=48710 RepID=A0ABP1RME8_9HEXA